MTEVFVWKNYGEVTVHAFETEVQQENLLKSVHQCARYFAAGDDEADIVDSTKNGCLSFKTKIRKLVLLAGLDNDSFEYGTGFYKVKE